jgi:hypothetical protein
LHQTKCIFGLTYAGPAAPRINCVIESGWLISDRWLAFTSIVLETETPVAT